MAKKAKDATDSEKSETVRGISAVALMAKIKEAIGYKSQSSELSGSHGALVKNVCEQHHLERKSFTWTRQLYELDGDKRAAVIRQSLDLWYKAGFFSQIDMFDDVGAVIERIAEKCRTAAATKKSDSGKVLSLRAGREDEGASGLPS